MLPSDGQISSFHSSLELWNNFLWAGFPAAAEPQYESWYPLSRLFTLLPNGFNGFMVLGYVLASSFTYGYVFSLTGSRFGALIGGTIFGTSGFMMAHLAHTAMIQSAIWLPLIFWSFEKLRSGFSIPWFIIAVVSVSCSFLGGHPQIFVYTSVLAMAYAMFLGGNAGNNWLKHVCTCLGVLVLALCLSAVQFLPTLEYSQLSVRNKLSFDEFVSFSLPPQQLMHLIFPFLFGGIPDSPYHVLYFGKFNPTELAGYIGILPLLLAAIGAWVFRKEKRMLFWSVTVVVTLLLVMGNATPLALLLYHIPIINYFRAPARHFLEFSFAVSVLAGIGAHAILSARSSGRLLRNAIAAAIAIMLSSLTLIFIFYGQLQTAAARLNIRLLSIRANPAVIIPLIVFALSIIAFVYWMRKPQQGVCQALLWIVVLVNMASFGWYYEWRYSAIEKRIILQASLIPKYKELLQMSNQRLLPLGGVGGQPDMFRLYQLPTIIGNSSLMLKRFAELSGVTTYGSISAASLSEPNRAIDLLAVQYILKPISPRPTGPATVEAHGIKWSSDDMGIILGKGCDDTHPDHMTLSLPEAVAASRLAIVTCMSCSTEVLDNQPVLEISLITDEGHSENVILHAGRDTSEFAWDCPVVAGLMKHKRAPIFVTWPASGNGTIEWPAHRYFTTLQLSGKKYHSINMRWLGVPGAVEVNKMTLIDEAHNDARVVAPPSEQMRFQSIETIGNATMYRNLRAQPRVWLASEVMPAKAEDILKAVRTSTLPDGRRFEPGQTALIEEPFSFRIEKPDPSGTARIVQLTNTRIEIQASSQTPTFMVMSDIYYPGWKAFVDGIETHIFRVDYALRGISLPAGGNIIRLEFAPLSFYLGGVLSVLALMTIIMMSAVHIRGKWDRKHDEKF